VLECLESIYTALNSIISFYTYSFLPHFLRRGNERQIERKSLFIFFYLFLYYYYEWNLVKAQVAIRDFTNLENEKGFNQTGSLSDGRTQIWVFLIVLLE